MEYSSIIRKLKSMRDENNIKGMARFGITGKEVLGISVFNLRSLAKTIPKNHDLALKLWDSGIHEARHLAVFIEEVHKITPEQMNKWAHSFESWDDTDQACTNLFDKTPHSWNKIREWAVSEEEFVKRAAFSLIAGLAVHDKNARDSQFTELFPVIKKASFDERNFVKKAVNWALRSIGKRNKKLNKKAIIFSKELVNSTSKTSKWIAKDAVKELESKKVQKRLK